MFIVNIEKRIFFCFLTVLRIWDTRDTKHYTGEWRLIHYYTYYNF